MTTKLRTSTQVYIDADLDHNGKKVKNIADGTVATDGVSLGQLTQAISDAALGGSTSLHVPVADLTAATAVLAAGRADKMLMLVETLGLYQYDLESMAVSNNDGVIRPTDIASDASAGRWIRIASALVDIAAKLNSAGIITTIADADKMSVLVSGVLKVITWENIKALLKTYFDTLYNKYVHPNHSGDVTSAADGAQTIAANAVTNAKLADMATQTFKGRNTAATGDPEDLSIATAKAMLGLNAANLSQRSYRATPTGSVNGSNVVFTIAALVLSGTEEVFLNGVLQNANGSIDYSITYAATTTITFAVAPKNADGYTDVVLVNYSF